MRTIVLPSDALPQCRPARWRLLVVGLLAMAVGACTAGRQSCAELPLRPEAEAALPSALDQLDFSPQRPCSASGPFVVSAVLVDIIARGAHEPRITFIVSRRGEEAFHLSETRDLVPFTAIPVGTHHVQVTAAGVTARGFSGPSGDGGDFAYLRWRLDEVTFELSATLRPWLTEADIRELAREQMSAAPQDR